MISYEIQKIEIDGVQNARQLGGYVCVDGRKIKDGVLLRSGALASLTAEGARVLSGRYNLKYVFDFRMDTERMSRPDKEVAGAENIALPVLSPAIYSEKIAEEMQKLAKTGNWKQFPVVLAKNHGVTAIYENMLIDAQGQQAYSAFFRTLLKLEEGGSVLWHCTQGKDRAGMASVLLLSALGADEETIKADYLLTNDFYSGLIHKCKNKAKELGFTEEETREYLGTVGVDEGFLNTAVESVKENYGSIRDYLKNQLGLTEDDIGTLREKFLE